MVGIFALLVATALLFLAFPHNFGANLQGLLLVQPISIVTLFFFGMRSRYALDYPFPVAKLVRANAIAIALSAFLPAKAGEFLKPAVLRRIGDVPLSSGFSMVLIERAFDSLVLVFLVAVGTYTGLGLLGTSSEIPTVILVAFMLLVGVALSLTSRRLRQFLSSVLRKARETLSDKPRLIGIGFFTMMVWSLSWGMMVVFGLASGHDDLGIRELTTIFVASTLGIAVGVTPGGWGIVEGITVGLLMLYGLSFGEALSFAIVFRLSVILGPAVVAVASIKRFRATQAGTHSD